MKAMVLFNYMENLGRMLLQSPPATRSATPHMFILSGQVLTEDRLFLLRKSMNAVSQLWVNKANSYIADLCLDFGFTPRDLSTYLTSVMPELGYTDKETNMLGMWIRGYETGIRMFININKQ